MAKFKFNKGELKRQRDALGQYQRYLPTLQLKKQQLQLEISHQLTLWEEKSQKALAQRNAIQAWAGLLSDKRVDLKAGLKPFKVFTSSRNIAGVDLPVFRGVEYPALEYDLFTTPLWVDVAVEEFRKLLSLSEEAKVLEKVIRILRQELRITTQRVNLFEKVKIPEAREAIRAIKIYLGDQMANAVGRSKIAKRKIEEQELVEVAA